MAGLVPAIHVLENSRMKSGWVYIMTNRANGTLYVRVTNDLIRRVYEHRTGAVPGFTKQYGLKKLVYFDEHQNIQLAIQREHNMKQVENMEGAPDIARQSRMARSVPGNNGLRTWMAGTSPATTVATGEE
jgi:putative endonuclease